MRLLFDQNLSYQPWHCSKTCTHSQIMSVSLVWLIKKSRYLGIRSNQRLVIVTRDADYLAIGAKLGHPPKMVRIGLGNCPTVIVADPLPVCREELQRFCRDERGAFIELR